MFDTRKFGRYLSNLRKSADMTQAELADILNLTRQAISRYELGESFPDISILISLADYFHVTIDEMISSGDPTRTELNILENIVSENSDFAIENFEDVVHLAPFLKPSILAKLAFNFSKQGIDISNIVALAEYLNDESVIQLLESASFDPTDMELLEKFLPMLDENAKSVIFEKILSGAIDWHFIGALFPYAGYLISQIEAAVVEGALPQEALELLQKGEIRAMKHHFLCPNCKAKFSLPVCHACGYRISQKGSVYSFCNDAGVKLDGEDQYIGYDNIGEDFEPAVAYWDANNVERYGVYEACGDLIAKTFGSDSVVLDLGAGLGSASIPLAKNGIYTIAVDISDVMLATAEKRAKGRFDNLILARMNAYELMIPDHSVDLVVENAMLHLVDNPEKVVQEIVRVLKPDGKLIRYCSPGQALSEEEWKRNVRCNEILADISAQYDLYLSEHHIQQIRFDNHFPDVIAAYFEQPHSIIAEGFTEVFVDKLKFRLHRIKTGALSDRQHVPKETLDAAWEYADTYAREKYGEAYIDIKGFSRYGASIEVYPIRKNAK